MVGIKFSPRPALVWKTMVFIALSMLAGWGSVHARESAVLVGVYDNPPKVFISESGEPAGIFIDILEQIARNERWNLEYVSGSWSQGLERLASGEIDLMPDVAHSAEREKIFSYHKVPVLSDWFQVYAAQDSNINSITDLDGKRVTVLERSVQEEAFERLIQGFGFSSTLIPLPNYNDAFEMVVRGEADAAITNRFFGMFYARKLGLEDTAVIFNPTRLYFAGPADSSKDILDAIDRNLLHFKQDQGSVYYQALSRWTAEDVHFSLPGWVIHLGLIVGLALVMSLGGSAFLKYKVDVRTRELRQINQEIEERIRQRTGELAEAMEKAQVADRIKSAFLATMSHELRTPLNSIIGFTGILLQGLAGPLNQEQHKQMTMVQHSARHLLSLINDVLDISKIEAGQMELSPESFDLSLSIDKLVKLISPQAGKKGIQVQADISPEIGTITADQRRLEQIILNLLNNAVKFTEHGQIRISCRITRDEYVLSVSDTGMGIPFEEQDKLFKPFHQVDTGTSRKHEGTGLGLSICKKLLDLMNGTISVKSSPGQGSTFTVTFPVK